MTFTSLWYFTFLCIAAVVYHNLSMRLKPYFLLFVSWFVYILFGIWHFALLIFVTVVSYGFGLLAEKHKEKKLLFMVTGAAVIAGNLFYVKYFDMFLSWMESAAYVLGGDLSFSERYMILPAGISFYTFQALSYMIDVYREEPAEKKFLKYALYISFFPQLVAGPIEQAGRLIPQMKGQRATVGDISVGCRYLLSGCIRKFVIADYMAAFADKAYLDVSQQSGYVLLLATVFFAVQIYCDFSGYTHIAIGSARFFGIYLTENFDRPYLAEGCRDFWKRWHITLTKWFTEYVYIPMGGSHKGRNRKYFNIMVVFLLSGLWHGADVKFMVWGAFFGVWRIIEEMADRAALPVSKREYQDRKNSVKIWFRRMITFGLVCVSWVFFRSQSVTEAVEVLYRIFAMEAGSTEFASRMELLGAALRIGILVLIPRIIAWKRESEKETVSLYYTITVLVFLIGVCILSIYDNGGGSSFIYFQF